MRTASTGHSFASKAIQLSSTAAESCTDSHDLRSTIRTKPNGSHSKNIDNRRDENAFSGVQDSGPLHTGQVPVDLFLRHRHDHRDRGGLRLRGEDRRLHGAARTPEIGHPRLLPQLHPLLHQPVQRPVHLHRLHLLHLEDGLPDRDRGHALGRHVVPPADVAPTSSGR